MDRFARAKVEFTTDDADHVIAQRFKMHLDPVRSPVPDRAMDKRMQVEICAQLPIDAGENVDVEDLIQPGHYEIIVDALQQVGDEALKPVKDFLGDAYSYEEIRLVRAAIRQAR